MKFPEKPNLVFGIIISLIASIFFSLSSSSVKFFRADFPTMQILFMQNFICLLAVTPKFIKEKAYFIPKGSVIYHLMRDLCGVACFYCFFLAIKKINLVDATLLAYSSPFFTPFIAKVWTKEKIDKGVWWSIILGFFGIFLILNPKEFFINSGAFLGVISAIFSAIALVALRQLNTQNENIWRTLFYYFLFGSIFSMPFLSAQWVSPSSFELMILIFIGLSSVIAQFLLTIAYKHASATFLNPLAYATVIYTGFISWIVFNNSLSYLSLFGAVLIILGGSMSYLIKTKTTTEPAKD
ncbi:MAG: EamA family transporter [Chlamydiae bacterium]|nr:EamA family transporter [Chlamydiota bacterium]